MGTEDDYGYKKIFMRYYDHWMKSEIIKMPNKGSAMQTVMYQHDKRKYGIADWWWVCEWDYW